jgi:hypothetical protein
MIQIEDKKGLLDKLFRNSGTIHSRYTLPDELKNDSDIKEAFDVLERASFDEETRKVYEVWLKEERDRSQALKGALKEGEEIGEKRSLKRSLVRQIHRKFGDVPIPSKVLIVIDGSDEEEFLDMTDRVWEVNTLEELVVC